MFGSRALLNTLGSASLAQASALPLSRSPALSLSRRASVRSHSLPRLNTLASASLAQAIQHTRTRPRSGLQKQVLGLYRRYCRAIRAKELPPEQVRRSSSRHTLVYPYTPKRHRGGAERAARAELRPVTGSKAGQKQDERVLYDGRVHKRAPERCQRPR